MFVVNITRLIIIIMNKNIHRNNEPIDPAIVHSLKQAKHSSCGKWKMMLNDKPYCRVVQICYCPLKLINWWQLQNCLMIEWGYSMVKFSFSEKGTKICKVFQNHEEDCVKFLWLFQKSWTLGMKNTVRWQ